MIVRLFAVLLAFGMLAISIQGPDLAVPTADAALVDEADAPSPPAIVEQPVILAPVRYEVRMSLPALTQPVPHRPELGVFRPPRAVAFV